MDNHMNGHAREIPSTPSNGTRASREPIAIVGIGCRFPGPANDPASFWQVLVNGVDAITEVPADRWDIRTFYNPEMGKPGKTHAYWGGFIQNIDQFDPHFFGISPREASRMDPQQRLLLEVSWEALEDGGQVLEQLASSKTAVFVGISCWDYAIMQIDFRDRAAIDTYTNTGGSLSIAANRISYCFDFRGPSAAVDTACSSSLVAVHLACKSIWEEQCPLALAGGVNALLLPDWYIGFSRLGMLSPDGRCKAFDARANGFVRAEGAGMVVLKPLSQALAAGDRIYAVIRGTAVNQDGRTPGMTVPSQEAQEALLRQAYLQAGVLPAQVQFVEAHGTGTLVGDPIEAQALGSVLSDGRPAERPCLVGSVKTNIGHLEAGSGIAGLIKTTLALHHRRIPGNLHFEQPNPAIDFAHLCLRIPQHCEPWPAGDGPLVAGVNSFGYGGTNAHIVLQSASEQGKSNVVTHEMGNGTSSSSVSMPVFPGKTETKITKAENENGHTPRGQFHGGTDRLCHPTHSSVLVPLSARSNEALRGVAAAWRQYLADGSSPDSLHDLAGNAAFRRSHHDHRLALVAHSKEELTGQLADFLAGKPVPGVSSARTTAGQKPRLVFVCSGQGPQWWAMGRQLLATEAVFREVIQRCDAVVRQLGSWSLLDELMADEIHSRMAVTAVSQPAIFALQVALAALWRSWGVYPEAVIGHSVGEVAAAYLAGVFSLEDAVRVIYQRGRCMELASARGRMLAIGARLEEAHRLVAAWGDRVSIAAINGPTSITLSGEASPLEEIANQLEQQQVFCRYLQVQYAFHSAQMDPVRDELLTALHDIQPRPATLPLFSTVSGCRMDGPELGPEYWWRNVRQTVLFAAGVERLIAQDCDTVLELSPHPVLSSAVVDCYRESGKKVHVLPSLRRGEDERATLLRSLGGLYTHGYPLDWSGVAPRPAKFVRLPLYPWQYEHFWFESDESRETRLAPPAHPLLGNSLKSPYPSWDSRLDIKLLPYLADHRVQQTIIVPATAYLEIAFAAARELFNGSSFQVEDLKLINPCFLSQDKFLRMYTVFQADDATLRIHSRATDAEQDWTTHSSAVVRSLTSDALPKALSLEEIQARCPRMYTRAECYAYFRQLGLDYGPCFQGVERAWQGDRESLAEICLPDGLSTEAEHYLFHPALLDSCFQGVLPASQEFDKEVGSLYLPTEIERVRLFRRPGHRLWIHARLIELTESLSIADIDIYNANGEMVALIQGLRSQRVAGDNPEEALNHLLYEYEWRLQDRQPVASPEPPTTAVEDQGHCLIFADRKGVGVGLATQLRAAGRRCSLVFAGTTFACSEDDCFEIKPGCGEDMETLLHAVLESVPEVSPLPVGEGPGVRVEAHAKAAPSPQPLSHGERGLPDRRFDARPSASRDIIHLWNLDAPRADGLDTGSLEVAQEAGLLSVIQLVQAWDRFGGGQEETRLIVVTCGAQSVGNQPEPTAVAQSPIIGLGRVIVSEYSKLRCKLVDLDVVADTSVQTLLDELRVVDDEDEIAFRGTDRYVHRYVSSTSQIPPSTQNGAGTSYRLATLRPGVLDSLMLRTVRRPMLEPGQVEIEVLAAGLNFSDLMKALGIYPGLPDGPVPFGAECSGRITAVGEAVRDLHVGDEVLAVAPFAFGSHVITRAELVALKPPQWSFEEAATLPIAFLTAAYALNHLAQLGAGERVLIHSATGGVGLAAIQLARRAGAEIFATAGTLEKRAYLQELGIEHVMDSRSLAFADEVIEATNGRGVDVVLNSLAGEALVRSFATLADYGRFLEIGKRDVYGNSRLGLRPFRKNLSFHAIDLDRMIRERPAVLGSLLRQLVQDARDGQLQPLPQRVYPIAEVVDAFRYMQHGKHIGKIVLSMREPPVSVVPGEETISFRADATYLITGGLGGFGLVTARWMAERGAKHLVLLGRRGVHSAETQQSVASLEELGAHVVVQQADVTKEEDVAHVLAAIDRSGFPLRGVFHTAMVLEDSLLLNLDWDLMQRVLAPKMSGAWNLHMQTLHHPLDYFVFFSSVASVFGHAGQGNYAAANAFLDALAWYRRALGLPALTVNWGYLGEVGYLAQRQQLGERLERQGVRSFTVRQALTLLERTLLRRSVQISVMRMDWSRWRGLGVTGRVSPRFAHLLERPEAADASAHGSQSALQAVLSVQSAERSDLLETLLRDKAARVLGTSSDKVDSETPLLHLGLDSLMAVELRNWIEAELRVKLSIMELMRSSGLSHLTDLLMEQVTKSNGTSTPNGKDNGVHASAAVLPPLATFQKDSAEELLAKIDEIPGERIDALLTTLLASKQQDRSTTP